MSLRLQLMLLIGALVALAAVSLLALQLATLADSLGADAVKQSQLAGQQASSFLTDHVNQASKDRATPATIDETRAMWREIVATDPDIATRLEKMMALSRSLLEINVADSQRIVLVSSNPARAGSPLGALPPFTDWGNLPLYRRVWDLLVGRSDYEYTVPIGSIGGNEPLFIVQVVSSHVFLKGALLPEVRRLGAISGAILGASLILTLLLTQTILRPLRRIEQTIDRIVQGNYGGAESSPGMAREFAAVESKLDLLGQKFRGARDDATELRHNIGTLLERMATQIDVSARLAAISRITSGVAHEIKNPLNAISLRLDLLRAHLGEPEEELVKEIDILSKEVLRLDRVVKTFLDFSRPLEVHFIELDLASLARDVCALLAPQAKLAGVNLAMAGPDRPTRMRGDADMLRQVILNLVTNAIDAMKSSGGKLDVKVANGAQAVTLDVSDNGPGIDPKLREKVFQLYFTTKPGGSGIGLAMTYRAVQLHNGTIDFESESGRGTTFHIQFPEADVHEADVPSKKPDVAAKKLG
jgi:signal transduction histidine kinase